MRQILTISLDPKLKEKIEKSSKKFNVSKSELVKKAVEKYIAVQEFNDIREILILMLKKQVYSQMMMFIKKFHENNIGYKCNHISFYYSRIS